MVFKLFVICAIVAYASAGLGGKSVQSRQQDGHGNYAFNYQVVDHLGAANGRSEVGSPGRVVGHYNIADIDGRVRRVDYVADEHGFRAKVQTNEPGTAASLPASAVIDSPFAAAASSPIAAPALPAFGFRNVAYAGSYY